MCQNIFESDPFHSLEERNSDQSSSSTHTSPSHQNVTKSPRHGNCHRDVDSYGGETSDKAPSPQANAAGEARDPAPSDRPQRHHLLKKTAFGCCDQKALDFRQQRNAFESGIVPSHCMQSGFSASKKQQESATCQAFAIDRYTEEGIQEALKKRGHEGMVAFLTDWDRKWDEMRGSEKKESKLCPTFKPLVDD